MSTTSTSHCPNCDHRLAPWDHYCSQCGQHAKTHAPTLWEFVHEWLAHYVALEGVLWKSLWALMLRPGFLTREYLAGRRRRYVLPLRLVLTLGLLFFIIVKFIPLTEPVLQVDRDAQVAEVQKELQGGLANAPDAALQMPDFTPAWLKQRGERAWAQFRKDPDAFNERLARGMLSMAPYAVLASIPFYAALLALLHWGRRRAYGEHFVFAMHLHAFWYGCLLLVLLPVPWLVGVVWVWSNVYPVVALRRVYGGGWLGVLLRAAALAFLHLMLLALAITVVLMVGALGG
jgi:hypothetical protein